MVDPFMQGNVRFGSVTAKIVDPIGLLTPFTVEMKILFQQLCLNNSNWNDELEGVLL